MARGTDYVWSPDCCPHTQHRPFPLLLCSKLVSSLVSYFSSCFVFYWKDFFGNVPVCRLDSSLPFVLRLQYSEVVSMASLAFTA